MAKEIKFGAEARAALGSWCKQTGRYSKSNNRTKRKKRCTWINHLVLRLITNDGVTIAKEIELEDAFENMGAQLSQRSCIQDK